MRDVREHFPHSIVSPLFLSDIKNVTEFANPAFWKCLRKYNQFSPSSLGTKPWARINIFPLESWFVAQFDILLNLPDKWHAFKHAHFENGATCFCAFKLIKLKWNVWMENLHTEQWPHLASLRLYLNVHFFIQIHMITIRLH